MKSYRVPKYLKDYWPEIEWTLSDYNIPTTFYTYRRILKGTLKDNSGIEIAFSKDSLKDAEINISTREFINKRIVNSLARLKLKEAENGNKSINESY